MAHGLSIAGSSSGDKATVWRQEGAAMLQAGLELQRLALTLPVESEGRRQLLDAAKRWFVRAKLRGAID